MKVFLKASNIGIHKERHVDIHWTKLFYTSMKEIVIIIQNKYYKGSIVNTSFIGCVTAYKN